MAKESIRKISSDPPSADALDALLSGKYPEQSAEAKRSDAIPTGGVEEAVDYLREPIFVMEEKPAAAEPKKERRANKSKETFPWDDPVYKEKKIRLAKHVVTVRLDQVNGAKLDWVVERMTDNKQGFTEKAIMDAVEKEIKRLTK